MALDSLGRVDGRLEARIARGAGDPAVSPDGQLVALTLPGPVGEPGRLVVWSTDTTTDAERDSTRRVAQERLAKRDPEDRLPVPQLPRGRTAKHTLHPVAGVAFTEPRWLPDGTQLLVVRDDFRSDGSIRPDLFAWTPATGAVRRITHGASVRDADPLPDGRHAVGTRCLGGQCDLVHITLDDGTVRTLVAGDAFTQYVRPRALANGTQVVASVQRGGRWRPVLVDVRSGATTDVGPDMAADRYDVTPTRDGRALLYVSDASGVPQLMRHDLATNDAVPLSRLFGAAMAPTPFPGDSSLLYLALDARGYELRRLSFSPRGLVLMPATLAARFADAGAGAVVPQPPRDGGQAFDTTGAVTPRGYGLGARRTVLLPMGGSSVDGGMVGGAIERVDPVGRLGWMLLGVAGTERLAERGGAARVSARLPWITLDAEAVGTRFALASRDAIALRDAVRAAVRGIPSGPPSGSAPFLADALATWRGATASGAMSRRDLRGHTGLRFGVALHDVRVDTRVAVPQPVGGAAVPADDLVVSAASGVRRHLFAEAERTLRAELGPSRVDVDVRGHLSRSRAPVTGAIGTIEPGTTANGATLPWVTRQLLQARIALDLIGPLRFTYDGLFGTVSDQTEFERFRVGGLPSLLLHGSAVPQRIPAPWLAAGTLVGADVTMHTVRWQSPLGVTPFASAVRSGGPWHRAVGMSADLSLLAQPFYRVPGIQATGGVAYLPDATGDQRVRAWAGVTYTP